MKPSLQLALSAVLLGATPLAFSVFAPPAQAAENAAQKAGRAAIVAQYRKGDVAVVRHDVATLMTTLAADYKSYGMDGGVANRAQAEATIRALLSGQINGVAVRFVKSETKIISLQWRGPDAIIMSQTTMVAVGSKDGRSVRAEVVGTARDYWGKTNKGWQIRQSATRSMKRWINGVRDPSM